MMARVQIDEREVRVDLASPVSLAGEISFDARTSGYFGAPPARVRPLEVGAFLGAVSAGASCNCSTVTFTPHCDGTHTESAGHLTLEALDAFRVIPAGLLRARVVTVRPEAVEATNETSDPGPRPGDRLVTRAAIESGWQPDPGPAPRALVLRTRAEAASSTWALEVPPYLSQEAATLLVQRRIEHLVVDLPSIDRLEDGGRLSAHRLFFGLAPGRCELAAAQRPHCTVTELARIPDSVADGAYLLQLQAPALKGDAVPSRPLLYAIAAH